MPDILRTITDRNLLGPFFSGPSWNTWRTIFRAAHALPMTDTEHELFRSIADRDPPRRRVRELWVIGGRRGGKDSAASGLAVDAAINADGFAHLLRPGEYAAVLCLARDRDQSQIVLRYIRAYFSEQPLLRDLVVRETLDGIELSNRVEIIVATNSFKSIRGRTVLLAILDECAFYEGEDSASSDTELYTALMPGLATLPGSALIGISTPYKRSGLLYEKWQRYYGQDDDNVLVIRAPSLVLNPTLNTRMIEEARERDPQHAAAEYLCEWRDDISGFLDAHWIERAATLEDGELPYRSGVEYFCFIDPSGGRSDAMTLAIAHREDDGRVVVDVVRGRRAPFDPASVVAEFAEVMQRYEIRRATADRYAAEWTVSSFAAYSYPVTIEPVDRSKSELYLEAEPMFAQGNIAIPRNKVLLNELRNLERRTHRGGRDSVDHPTGAGWHDDFANACCGVLALVGAKLSGLEVWCRLGQSDPPSPAVLEAARVAEESRRAAAVERFNAQREADARRAYIERHPLARLRRGDEPLIEVTFVERTRLNIRGIIIDVPQGASLVPEHVVKEQHWFV